MNLDEKIALVTGAGSGLGRALAVELARRGCKVALVGRRVAKLEETKTMIEGDGGTAKCWPGDVSVSVDVENIVHDIQLEWGMVDILINNAGVFPERVMVQEMDIAEWDETMATNVRGPFLLIRAVLKPMLERDSGRILNISAPLKHYPGAAAYCASKCALDSLTKAIAFENKESAVRINAVEPPLLDTEMHTGGPKPETVVDEILQWVDPGDELGNGRIHKIKT
jgi:3-oxoacyl-[acyl-carrier protein] reductase